MRARNFTAYLVLLGTFGIVVVSGCSEGAVRKYSLAKKSILQERMEKDTTFRLDKDSPIPPQDKIRFPGLVYYTINQNLRLQAHLNRYLNPEQVRLSTNTGEIRSGLRYGYIDFQIDGQACRLHVYQLDDQSAGTGQARLFIPFRDSTSGTETYPAGRYIDLTEDASGAFDLDFNRAYNPSCAYGGSFSCPIPPVENTLSVPIRAGEKKYMLNHKGS